MSSPPPLRVAVAVRKGTTPAETANAAAIVTGQLALLHLGLFEPHGVVDLGGAVHAAIRYNTVVLTGRQGQLDTLLTKAADMNMVTAAFSKAGRSLNNAFAEYTELVQRSTAEQLDTFAIGLAGPDDIVRQLTRPLSAYQWATASAEPDPSWPNYVMMWGYIRISLATGDAELLEGARRIAAYLTDSG